MDAALALLSRRLALLLALGTFGLPHRCSSGCSCCKESNTCWLCSNQLAECLSQLELLGAAVELVPAACRVAIFLPAPLPWQMPLLALAVLRQQLLSENKFYLYIKQAKYII